MRRRKLYAEDIALAMELRNEGEHINDAAYLLDVSAQGLRLALLKAELLGFKAYPLRDQSSSSTPSAL
jgi:hypothetical protein